jgi:hypothetical protein
MNLEEEWADSAGGMGRCRKKGREEIIRLNLAAREGASNGVRYDFRHINANAKTDKKKRGGGIIRLKRKIPPSTS